MDSFDGILVIIGVPMVVTILVGSALLLRGARSGAGPIPWTITGVMVVFNLLALLSIGIVILPVTVCLVIACTIHQSRAVVLRC